MLDAKNLSLSYGKKLVLDNISLTLGRGELLAVLGANGAGKSTLIKTLSGTLKPERGQVFLAGEDVYKMSARALAKKRAVLEQETSLEFSKTIFELVASGGFARAPILGFAPDESANVECALREVGLENFAKRQYETLSGGEKRRAQLARVLCQIGCDCAGKIIFLDEPSAGLDPSKASLAMRVAKKLCKRGASAIAVLHDPNLALAYANRCALLKTGKILAFGETSEVLNSQNLSETYSTRCEIAHTQFGKFAVFPQD